MRYKVTFQFLTEDGEARSDYLNNNGRGFALGDAYIIARQLRQNSNNWNVAVEEMNAVQ